MRNAILTNRMNNPRWQHLYFDNIDCYMFIHKHFPGDVANAYDLLIIPGAYKSDLFRLAVLCFYGGCYMDCSMISQIALETVIEKTCVYLR